jgi:hypothetical protein
MLLIVLLFSATISTALWYSKAEDDKYMLKFLSLILWGASIMVFVDHVVGYLARGRRVHRNDGRIDRARLRHADHSADNMGNSVIGKGSEASYP